VGSRGKWVKEKKRDRWVGAKKAIRKQKKKTFFLSSGLLPGNKN
jgi:hypothetical protein